MQSFNFPKGPVLFFIFVLLSLTVSAQNGSQQPAGQEKTLADYAREKRGDKAKPAPTATPQKQMSLSELAAEQRSKRTTEIKLSSKNGAELLKEVDSIMEFASNDTGFPIRAAVKNQIVGEEEVKRHWASALSSGVEAQRLERSELVLKKFGYLPPDFTLKKFLVDSAVDGLGGFYDPRNKTMNLVNWVGLEEQRPIMAHELTHALQDQNYDLLTWEHGMKRSGHNAIGGMQVDPNDAQESDARRAVVEGQAMIVYFDYTLTPFGRRLVDSPSAMDYVNSWLTSSYDTSLVVHDAPLLFRDSAIFPYREGVIFELELLRRGGIHKAFVEPFSHPPVDTHQILEPKAYFSDERIAPVVIPDLSDVLGSEYESYDTGSIGQLDVRVMTQQFGTENDMFSITPEWKGGSYVAVKRRSATGNPKTADIALVYLSRWKEAEAAERFVELYRKSLSRRVTVVSESRKDGLVCMHKQCALWATQVVTSEGPVNIEIWPNHTVFITHSLSDENVALLRQKALFGAARAQSTRESAPELSQKVQLLSGFASFRSRMEWDLWHRLPWPAASTSMASK